MKVFFFFFTSVNGFWIHGWESSFFHNTQEWELPSNPTRRGVVWLLFIFCEAARDLRSEFPESRTAFPAGGIVRISPEDVWDGHGEGNRKLALFERASLDNFMSCVRHMNG